MTLNKPLTSFNCSHWSQTGHKKILLISKGREQCEHCEQFFRFYSIRARRRAHEQGKNTGITIHTIHGFYNALECKNNFSEQLLFGTGHSVHNYSQERTEHHA